MRVFMLGWEFPPFISGGLGTACYGLTKALSGIGADIMFVLPRPVSTPFSTHVRLVSPRPGSPLASPSTEFRLDEFEHVTFRTVDAQMTDPYQTAAQYAKPPEAPVANLVEERNKRMQATVVEPMPDPVAKPAAKKGDATPGFIGSPHAAAGSHYAGDMFSEIQRYAALAAEIARNESFDIV